MHSALKTQLSVKLHLIHRLSRLLAVQLPRLEPNLHEIRDGEIFKNSF